MYWILKWPLWRGMIRHVIPRYLLDLIDKICGDLTLFPRSMDRNQHQQRGRNLRTNVAVNPEKDELELVFIYIHKHKLQNDRMTS